MREPRIVANSDSGEQSAAEVANGDGDAAMRVDPPRSLPIRTYAEQVPLLLAAMADVLGEVITIKFLQPREKKLPDGAAAVSRLPVRKADLKVD